MLHSCPEEESCQEIFSTWLKIQRGKATKISDARLKSGLSKLLRNAVYNPSPTPMLPDAPKYAAAWFDDRREHPPPKYTKSGDPPKYHRQPSTSEQRLLVNGGRAFEFLQSTCTKTTAKRDITVKLYGQDPEIDVPVYGKSARVEGTVALSFKPSEVSKVSVKVGY
jgi:hypothetical protein